MGYPCSSDPWARCVGDMLGPALCPAHALQLTLPSTGRLPSTVSAADFTRRCSRLHRYYAAVRLLTCVHAHRAAVAFMGRSGVPPDTDEVSQVPTKGRLHVHGVFDCARLLIAKPFQREMSPSGSQGWSAQTRNSPRHPQGQTGPSPALSTAILRAHNSSSLTGRDLPFDCRKLLGFIACFGKS